MTLDTFLAALLVFGMSLGTAAVILAAIILGHRRDQQAQDPETQDDFTASIRKWGEMQDEVRK